MRALLLVMSAALLARPLPAQCPDGSPPPCARRLVPARLARDSAPSLVVLYLVNLTADTADTADAALADGLTDELVVRLSTVPGLRVASRYSALRFRGRRQLDPRQVGRELGVRYVLQGTLRRAGARQRVVVEVTDAASGYNVWGHAYDVAEGSVFTVQDSVALAVAEAVRGGVTPQERARLVSRSRTDPEVMTLFLRGRAAIRTRSAAAGSQGIAFFRRVIALDPAFAPAHAALAHAYVLAMNWGWELVDAVPDSLPALAQREATRALALDSSSSDAWLAAAVAVRDSSPARALAHLHRALARDSTNIEALHQLAYTLVSLGQLDSGIAVEEAVTRRDPYYALAYAALAQDLIVARRPIEALARCAQGLAIDSTHAPLYWYAADAYLLVRRPEEARAAAARGLALGLAVAPMRALMALATVQAGDSARGRRELARVAADLAAKHDRAHDGLSHFEAGLLSGAFAQAGQLDSAIAWAQRMAPGQRRFYATQLERHWTWDPVRDDPRFQRLIEDARR